MQQALPEPAPVTPAASPQTAALLHATDWAATPLGPMADWPQSLRIALGICLNSRFPMFVWWGEQLVNLYNDAYIPVLGQRHPRAFGRPAAGIWQEIWPVVGPQAEQVMRQGRASWNERVPLLMERNGYAEETWFTWSYSPIPDEAGGIGGLFCACTEDTHHVRVERERDALQAVEARTRRRDRFIIALDAAVRPLADPAEIATTCARLLGEHVGADGCAYAEVHEDEDGLEIAGGHARGVAGLVGSHRLADYGSECLRLLRAGRPYVVNDVAAQRPSSKELAAYRRAAIRALVCVPLHKAGRLVAGMALHQAVPRDWQREEVDLALHATRRCLESIEHARTLHRLRESEERSRAAAAVLQESESRFRMLADSAPVMIWVTRPDGSCEYINARWQEFTGQAPEQAEGYGWLEPVHPDDRTGAEQAFLDANVRRLPFTLEYRLRHRGSSYRWCIDSAAPRFDAAGGFLGYVGSVIDITERKRDENALAAEKRALELIATGAPLGQVLEAIVLGTEAQSADGLRACVLVLDGAGERLRLGAAPSLPADYGAAIDGLSIGPGMGGCGTAAYERRVVISPDLQSDPCWEPVRALALRHGLGACCSLPILSADGRLHGTVALYYDRVHVPSEHDAELGRSATHLAGIVLEKHRLDAQLRRSLAAEQAARSEAERASRMKDEFLATLSHELRTPLNAILGWVAILRHKGQLAPELTPELAQGVAVIERNARAQAQIINDLLDMSAIISGKVGLEAQPVDLRAIVRLAVETLRPTAAAKRIALELDDGAGGALELLGDPNRLQQILWNLLSNAVKFSAPEGRIEVRLARRQRGVELSVSDEGEGIDADFLPFVFDRFRQADATTARRHGGLGLGLSIVKKLVELHGGAVEVASAGPGRGARFTVRLPLAADAAPAREASHGGAAPPAAASAGAADVSGLKVLLVDDDSDGRLMTQRLLEQGRAVVTAADSAAAALSLLGEQRFDVLVSDIAMPGTDGYALLRQVRALEPERGGDIAAVALTAYAGPQDEVRALEAGFQQHVSKPVEPDRLMSALASVARPRH